MFGEVGRRAHHALLRMSGAGEPISGSDHELAACGHVELGELGLEVGVAHHDPPPAPLVAAGRRLLGDVDAVVDHVVGHGSFEIEPEPYGPCRRERVIDRGDIDVHTATLRAATQHPCVRASTTCRIDSACEHDGMDATPETTDELRRSFFYGSRSNLNVKFLKDLDDAEFGDFLEELFAATSATADDGDASRVTDVMFRWQVHAYSGHLGDPADFPHRHDDTPIARLAKPLAEATVALLTSSGHFVSGDDPAPLGVVDMTQAEAEARIGEFLREAPVLSTIPVDVDPADLRVRHGGYPVASVAADHQVALPLQHLRNMVDAGTIGALAPNAYSFVGAASQGRIRRDVGPEWAQRLVDEHVDAVLLVPV